MKAAISEGCDLNYPEIPEGWGGLWT